MIDSLRKYELRARELGVWRRLGLDEREYVLVTLHRPSNVDSPGRLTTIVDALARLSRHAPVVFPLHPRTRASLEATNQIERLERSGVLCTEALGYLDFLSLESGAGAVVSDSGGIQEETSALGIPCYTFRRNTERPITLTDGTNVLIGDDPRAISIIRPSQQPPVPSAIPGWDGHAGSRVADVLASSAVLDLPRRASAWQPA